MRRVLVSALVLSLMVPASSAFAAGAGQAPGTASIAGSARGASGKAAANATVRVRDVATGQLSGTTSANAAGQFSVAGLNAGNYIVEVVNAAGEVIGTSAPIAVAAGAAVTGVGISAAAMTMAIGGPASFFGSAFGIATIVGAGLGVAGVAVAVNRPDASPSK